jgi:hypothetical protein
MTDDSWPRWVAMVLVASKEGSTLSSSAHVVAVEDKPTGIVRHREG